MSNSGESPATHQLSDPATRFDLAHKVLFGFGLVAPLLTFAIAVSDLSIDAKTLILAAFAVIYVAVCGWLYTRHRSRAVDIDYHKPVAEEFVDEIEGKLLALEEADRFFGSSLRSADMFRLVASRVAEIFPFEGAVLWVADEAKTSLRAVYVYGDGNSALEGAVRDTSVGLSGISYLSGEVEYDRDLSLERAAGLRADGPDIGASAAIPLIHDSRPFAVFQMYVSRGHEFGDAERMLLSAIGERIAPLLLGAQAVDRTISGALVDKLTELPNERALFMVLENQVAESQRFRDERPLTVLAVDIKDFDEANKRLGPGMGDELLRFAGSTLRSCLRKMDFLARTMNDEFTIVLPTANEKTAQEIMERIRSEFAALPFVVSEHEELKLWLNFGWATFWADGESSEQLLQAARLRKQQAKSADGANVLWFSKDYVN
ncbi:MAG TPA: sensor domain-containing diguanylate cyclase [Pyrinomonadaceae bacterium]|nr:sensor domain-containing diguanylate cyclase [Pyrinomonadaceae bacterium]